MKLDAITQTPVYLKTDEFVWPKDRMFYLMTRDGLMLCRNHAWFESCVPAKKGPSELGEQKEFCRASYPKIPQLLFEKAVGFFAAIHTAKGWEAAVVLVWNSMTKEIELVCPEQKNSWGAVNYDLPNLPPGKIFLGDIHSHPSFSPDPSMTDKDDEKSRPGIHLIVGDLKHEPPELHCSVVVDGERFDLKDGWDTIEDYIQRDTAFPQEWLEKVKEKKYAYEGSYGDGGYSDKYDPKEPPKEDKDIIKRILETHLRSGVRPALLALQGELLKSTKLASMPYCDDRAEKFLKHWVQLRNHYEKTKAVETEVA